MASFDSSTRPPLGILVGVLEYSHTGRAGLIVGVVGPAAAPLEEGGGGGLCGLLLNTKWLGPAAPRGLGSAPGAAAVGVNAARAPDKRLSADPGLLSAGGDEDEAAATAAAEGGNAGRGGMAPLGELASRASWVRKESRCTGGEVIVRGGCCSREESNEADSTVECRVMC